MFQASRKRPSAASPSNARSSKRCAAAPHRPSSIMSDSRDDRSIETSEYDEARPFEQIDHRYNNGNSYRATHFDHEPDRDRRQRAKTMIDWRASICDCLQQPQETPDDILLDALEAVSTRLQEFERLKEATSTIPKNMTPRYQVINRVSCVENQQGELDYLDPPMIIRHGGHNIHLKCSQRVNNLDLYLERNKEVTFLVYRVFECCGPKAAKEAQLGHDSDDEMLAESLRTREYVSLVSHELREALNTLSERSLPNILHPNFLKDEDEDEDEDEEIQYPYLWWFHSRESIDQELAELTPAMQYQIEVFQRYLEDSLGHEWNMVDELISSRLITNRFIHYLFMPKEVVISKAEKADSADGRGLVLADWAEVHKLQSDHCFLDLSTLSWTFDGTFRRVESAITVESSRDLDDKFSISDLTVIPARLASSPLVQAIQERGKMYWKCRRRNYVSLKKVPTDGLRELSHARFMVDMVMYKRMHPPKEEEVQSSPQGEELEAALLQQDNPELGNDFFMCLPPHILGFDMQKKEWISLQVGNLQDVVWNEDAFELLAIEKETKDLVQAVVTHRIQAKEQTDVIPGKGNGLFLLLHGGPGTGKTLTAESVAEIARKPLYRVTCGDIGTKPEVVEEYLETVLMLGTEWDCVVLLDEADVFLEARSMNHLERNALVSVFLRVLEYYDGILILTSNRVGTFDEAFKSRIQLSLRYHNLTLEQRYQIWKNFLKRLEMLENFGNIKHARESGNDGGTQTGIDTECIRDNLSNLAKTKLNGREIRNTISTARQLAMFKGERMSYVHLERVIKEALKFEEYITHDLQRGLTTDDVLKDRGVR